MNVTEHAAQLTRECPSRPCFMASVRVQVPALHTADGAGAEGATVRAEGAVAEGVAVEGVAEAEAEGAAPYVYTAFVNSNRDTVVRHEDPTATAPCL